MDVRFGTSKIHGTGVFACRKFQRGDVVEVCPAVILPDRMVEPGSPLDGITYAWGDATCAVALGYGSLYNHADRPNAEAVIDVDAQTVTIVAVRGVDEGDEVTVRYVPDPADLWFSVRG